MNANLSGNVSRHKFKKIHAIIRLAFELTASVLDLDRAQIGHKARLGAVHVNNIESEFCGKETFNPGIRSKRRSEGRSEILSDPARYSVCTKIFRLENPHSG
jgi:hypothetical protein